MEVCETWLARDFLARAGRPLDIPPCDHPPAHCPPVTTDTKEPPMTTPAGDRYITHRQQGFAAKDQSGNYLYRCVCGWTSGYLPETEGKAAFSKHLRKAGGAR